MIEHTMHHAELSMTKQKNDQTYTNRNNKDINSMTFLPYSPSQYTFDPAPIIVRFPDIVVISNVLQKGGREEMRSGFVREFFL
jgi:hypothetical protein